MMHISKVLSAMSGTQKVYNISSGHLENGVNAFGHELKPPE